MSGLWRKELRSIRPFLGLVLAVMAFGLLDETLSGLASARPMAQAYEEYIALGREGTTLCFLLAFALASGLLVREYDEGTMEFLDSLPVSRSRVFAVKVTLALLLLWLLIVLDVATGVFLHALSRHSLDQSFHFSIVATAVFLRACQLFVLLSLGLALSFLRRFGWLIMALLFWGYILLRERMPSIAVLDLFALARPQFEGEHWVVPKRMLAVQLSLAVVMLAVAYAMFLGLGDRIIRGLRKLTQSRFGNACLVTGGLLVAIACGSLVYRVMEAEYADYEPDENGVVITYRSWSTSRSRTEHYEFIYSTSLAGRAGKVIDGADSVHAKVREFFAADAGAPIIVDATSFLPRHAGIAYWDKIRLDLSVTEDTKKLRSILGHETAHVYLERLADSRLAQEFNSTRFFHEGVASYVEYHLFDPKPGVDALRGVAAVMHSRGEVKFEELVNSELLSARRDADLVYPLGEMFVQALVHRYGETAIGKIVRALVRKDAPRGLTGVDLWRDVFQACGYDLDSVLDEFFAGLDAERDRHRELIDKLPRLRGVLTNDGNFVFVFVPWEPIDGWSLVCRFRNSADDDPRFYLRAEKDREDVFRQSRDAFPGSRVWYQLGLSDGEERVIYEPWLQVTLD